VRPMVDSFGDGKATRGLSGSHSAILVWARGGGAAELARGTSPGQMSRMSMCSPEEPQVRARVGSPEADPWAMSSSMDSGSATPTRS
jgi:hypothetical protein